MIFGESRVHIFSDFTDEEKNKFLSICSREEVKDNEIILEEGQVTRSLFIIHEGEVAINLDTGGIKYEVVRLGNGDFFGEMSFLDGKLHSASVSATRPTSFYIIRKISFDKFAKENPEISKKFYENIIKTLLTRLRHSNDIIKKLQEEK